MTTAEPQRISVKRYLARLAARLTVFLILYVLSIGPMFWQWYGAYYVNGPKIIVLFYAPLRLACEMSDLIRDFLSWYINLWIL